MAVTVATKHKVQSRSPQFDKAKKVKDDEFYTPKQFVIDELKHYAQAGVFKDKTIYCPCDKIITEAGEHNRNIDPALQRGSFPSWLHSQRERFGIKKLIYSSFEAKDIVKEYQPDLWGNRCDSIKGLSYVSELGYNDYTDGTTISKVTDDDTADYTTDGLNKFWEEADIVITNPPFSNPLFKQFVDKCIYYKENFGTDFIFIGPYTALTYGWMGNYLFDKVNLGINRHYSIDFVRPDGETKNVACNWYTSFNVEEFDNGCNKWSNGNLASLNYTVKQLEKDDAVRYKWDNYKDTLEVKKRVLIPKDYYDWMFVPVTVFDYWKSGEFQYGGTTKSSCSLPAKVERASKESEDGPIDTHTQEAIQQSDIKAIKTNGPRINGKEIFARVIIRRKEK